jgi:predicted enzyme related to lactoylglutathione lyase
MARVIHFDISALKPERFIEFYRSIFGWKFEKWGDGSMEYWMINTGGEEEPGINGGLSLRQKDNYIVNSISVPDIDKTIKEIEKNGGKIIHPKTVIPGIGYYAMFNDTEDNLLSIMQDDPKAE